MRRNTTLARGSIFRAALGNAMQDEAVGLIPATDAPSTLLTGGDGRWWTTPDAGVASATVRVVDTSVDWRSRKVWGFFRNLGAADRRPGKANDHLPNDPATAATMRPFSSWIGAAGAVGAAGATVANGTPPVVADDSTPVVLDEGASSAARVWLYARPSDGVLCLYNASGATLHGELLLWGAAAAPTPGAPPPDVLPGLTRVFWLAPGLAADRPADPEGPALYRATDTGDFSIFDGATWRALGGSGAGVATSPLTEDLDADGYAITGLPSPALSGDAATKGYVDTRTPFSANGDLLTRAAGVPARIAIGANGYVMLVVAGMPTWSAAPWVTATGTILTGRVLAWDGSAWVATALSASYVGAVPVARTITSGAGLSGGGDLSADRTLSVSFGSSSGTACEGNDSRLSNSRAPTAHASTHATGGGDAITPGDIGAAPTSRTITAGTGLTGGGDLSADRTLTVAYGTSSSTACVGNDARLSDTRTPSAASVTLSTLAAPVLGLVETTVALPIAPGQHAAPTSGSEVIGLVYFLPSRYAVTGLTTTLSVEAIGYVESGCTLTLDVLDVTSGYTGASSVLGAPVTWTETDPTRKTATITLPGSGKIYAATISKNTSAGAYLSALNLLVARS